MKKFNLIGIKMTSNVSVIPTSARLCIKSVEAKYTLQKAQDLLSELPEDSYYRKVITPHLEAVGEFIQAIVDTLADENNNEDDNGDEDC